MGEPESGRSDEACELAERYVDLILKWDEAMSKLYVRRANDIMGSISEMEKRIIKSGQTGREELQALMEHANLRVRSFAAVACLGFDSEKAVQVLEKLSKNKGMVGFEAKWALKEWWAGRLRQKSRST